MKKLFYLFFLSALVLSCEEDAVPEQDIAPSITVIKPIADVADGDDIQVIVEFADDKRLQHAEISLSATANAGAFYDYHPTSLSGTAERIEYTVQQPTGIDIIGQNFITVTCRDHAGNSTVTTETFNIVDNNQPTGSFVYTDLTIGTTSASEAEVVYNVHDDEMLDKVEVELWQVDANGNKISLMDNETQLTGALNDYQGQHFFKGKSNYTVGDSFRFFIRVYDKSGNFVEIASPDIGKVI